MNNQNPESKPATSANPKASAELRSTDGLGRIPNVSKQVLIPADDYEQLPWTIVRELLANSKKSYGTKLVRCEDGGEITDENEAYGALIVPLQKALGLRPNDQMSGHRPQKEKL